MMEQLGNYSLVNQEIINFEKRFKQDLSWIHLFCIWRIRLSLKDRVEELNNKKIS